VVYGEGLDSTLMLSSFGEEGLNSTEISSAISYFGSMMGGRGVSKSKSGVLKGVII